MTIPAVLPRHIGAIYNPVAGNGHKARQWGACLSRLEGVPAHVTAHVTAKSGDARQFAIDLVAEGAEAIICCGGDGTINEVADGLLAASGGENTVPLGVLPFGTGSDVIRSHGLPTDLDALMAALTGGRRKQADLLAASFIGCDGAAAQRVVVNVASLGLSAQVAVRVNNASRNPLLRGKLMFIRHAVAELIRFRPRPLSITVDGGPAVTLDAVLVAVANGRGFGGGVAIAPEAKVDDGMLDVIAIRAAPPLRLISQLPKVRRGAHLGLPEIAAFRGQTVTISTPVGGAIEIDGETPGQGPLTCTVLPGVLTLIG